MGGDESEVTGDQKRGGGVSGEAEKEKEKEKEKEESGEKRMRHSIHKIFKLGHSHPEPVGSMDARLA